jgi:hypothetical protein
VTVAAIFQSIIVIGHALGPSINIKIRIFKELLATCLPTSFEGWVLFYIPNKKQISIEIVLNA